MPHSLKLHATLSGLLAERDGELRLLRGLALDELFAARAPRKVLQRALASSRPVRGRAPRPLAPVQSQEVWAAGVTYLRSRSARMEESQDTGGGSFYDRVYSAGRPELFFKSTASRVIAPGGAVRIRGDSNWNVPEPELALAINAQGRVFGYTLGNDMSSRSIEGENPLYLPQAKVYDGACSLGPALLVTDDPLESTTAITLTIDRDGVEVFRGETKLDQLKRTFAELASWLCRELSFPHGAYLLTGTGVVPPNDFTLQPGDRIAIACAPIGTLRNRVAT